MSTSITETQRRVHVGAETVALVAVTPFLLWVATRDRPLTRTEKVLLGTVVIGTVAVDGWLLYRFTRRRRR